MISHVRVQPVGRFFSMQQGRVGQFLSPRVLLVRKPFQTKGIDRCYFGFDRRHQARRFMTYLARTGCYFRFGPSQKMVQRYEIEIFNPGDLAKTIAYWDRHHDAEDTAAA
jgi:hypothetical protein